MTTYYVDGALGDNANAGTSEGAGNAWATCTYADANTVAGDTIYVKASADYAEQLTITVVGTSSAWKHWIGYTTTPGDGGKATITGSSSRTRCLYNASSSAIYHRFENFIFEDATGDAFDSGTSDVWMFVNCEFNSSGNGADTDRCVLYINCKFSNNTGDGVDVAGVSCLFLWCQFDGNGAYGCVTANAHVLFKCIFSDNASGHVRSTPTLSNIGCVLHCTMDGNNATNNGMFMSVNTFIQAFCNNIVYDNDVGVDRPASGADDNGVYVDGNLFYSNTTDRSDFPAGVNDVSGDPKFRDEGSLDFSTLLGSAARQVAITLDGATDGSDIGAVQTETTARPVGYGGGLVG
jgi:hypothetical protein